MCNTIEQEEKQQALCSLSTRTFRGYLYCIARRSVYFSVCMFVSGCVTLKITDANSDGNQ